MRLIIAEKPSLARAIAAALPGQSRRIANHIQCSTGDVVAWCAGHVLEMAPPEDYSESLRTWSLDTLPIVPKDSSGRISGRDRAPAGPLEVVPDQAGGSVRSTTSQLETTC